MMLLQFTFLKLALLLCLILTGLLGMYGFHVVRRGVIFVDLALAQIAALGAAVGLHFGIGQEGSWARFGMSLAFTLFGALVFAGFRFIRRVPIEALIGVAYAAALSLSLIMVEKSAHGAEELKEMLMGSLLTAEPKDILQAAGLALILGTLMFFSRKALIAISENHQEISKNPLRIWIWDFIFYGSFGVLVTFSVRLTGVLLVFAFLIIPPLAARLWGGGIRKQMLLGWIFGALGCVFGLEASVRWDTAVGPTLVSVLVALLFFLALVRGIFGNKIPG